MTDKTPYRIAGSYYEACNCDAICPCRRQNGAPGGRSTYGDCDFLLSWQITKGHLGDIDISDLGVAIAGTYNDDIGSDIWSVFIYIDEQASDQQFDALSQIFSGKVGGNFGIPACFTTILGVKPAAIRLDHTAGAETIHVGNTVSSNVVKKFEFDGTVTCGIPGHDHPGQEYVCDISVQDAPLSFSYAERCGFATDFAYWN